MRDALFLPLATDQEIVITTDCSGAIGEKADDIVHVSNNVVAYFAMRVAVMEMMAVGGTPTAVILANLSGNEAWNEYVAGINQAMEQLNISSLEIVGSSETNFSLKQSALGLTVIGVVDKQKKRIKKTPQYAKFAVIGKPLVGEAVLNESDRIAPLSLFRTCLEMSGIYELVPIGSKGVLYELEQLLSLNDINKFAIQSTLDLKASSGPATAFLISYDEQEEEPIIQAASQHFHKIVPF